MTVCTSAPIDIRNLAPNDRYSVASAAFGLLAPGEALELVHNENLKALKLQFDCDLPGKISWVWLEQGPAVWRASLTRPKSGGHGNGGCCGGCGGA